MGSCSGNCSSCSSKEGCNEKKDMHLKQNEYSNIKKIYAVVSGKGGVGKSSVTAMLATATQSLGNQVAVLDADITGPSIPKMFGIKGRAEADATGLLPKESGTGIRVMSVNLLLPMRLHPLCGEVPL